MNYVSDINVDLYNQSNKKTINYVGSTFYKFFHQKHKMLLHELRFEDVLRFHGFMLKLEIYSIIKVYFTIDLNEFIMYNFCNIIYPLISISYPKELKKSNKSPKRISATYPISY